jgi:beta-glucosidase
LQAYRFSVSWARVLPAGTGAVNTAGLDFYDRLVDELMAAGVQPWLTLFHWDYPLALYRRGGWLNRDSVEWFGDYTQVVVDKLSDRVRHWITLNEPQCFIGLGHQSGGHAPGDRLALPEVLLAGHHALLAHGRAVQVIRARAKQPATIGWAPVGVVSAPADAKNPADIEAARHMMFGQVQPPPSTFPLGFTSLWNNAWWGDPVVFGRYPEFGVKAFGAAMPDIRPGDMELISQPIDFYGANIYNTGHFRAGPEGKPVVVPRPAGYGQTANRWPVTPDALYWGPRFLHEQYKLPVVVTENGMSGMDWVALDGSVHDAGRIDFLARYLRELRRAVVDGVDVRGYFQWSLTDNFEWAEGFKERFGLIHIDYATQKRTPKDSAWWYREVIASRGASLG